MHPFKDRNNHFSHNNLTSAHYYVEFGPVQNLVVWYRMKSLVNSMNKVFKLFFGGDLQLSPKQALVFMCLQYKSLENTVGKGEIARSEQFLLFPQCLLPVW